MKKYKIDNYIVKADSIRDAVTIVKTINNSVKDKRVFGFGNFPYEYWLKNNDGGWFLAAFSKKKYDRSEIEALRKKYMLKNGKLPDYQEKIVDSVKDAELHSIKFEGARIEYAESNHNTSGVDTWTTPDKINKWLERENLSAYEKYKKRGGGYDKIHIDFKYLIDGKHYAFHALRVDIGESSKFHKIENGDIDYVTQVIEKHFKHSDTLPQGLKRLDSVKDSRRINYDDDIIEVTLNGKVVFRGYAEDWLDNNFDSNFKWTGSQYEASNAKGKWVVRVIDSFQKDSLTVRDVIQSLINEETSAISSYNVALETLKDHIPAEAYEAIKAIRDDEQRHVENLYAVLNGNVTPKNLEN